MSGEVPGDKNMNGDLPSQGETRQNGDIAPTQVGEERINLGFVLGESDTDNKVTNVDEHHIDVEPHDIITELDVFCAKDEEWVEHARWIKYEQIVEEDAARWSKPQVSSLSFHSLIELRKCLEHGSVLFDVEEEWLPDIMKRITDQMVEDRQLHDLDRGIFKWTMQQRHRFLRPGTLSQLHHHHRAHVRHPQRPRKSHPKRKISTAGTAKTRKHSTSRKGSGFDRERNPSFSGDQMSPKSSEVSMKETQFSAAERKERARGHWVILRENLNKVTGNPTKITLPEVVRDIMELNHAQKFVKHLQEGSETGAIMVGEVDFVEHPVCAFVRLSEGREMGIQLVEIPLPVRFIFVYLVPVFFHQDVIELGRTMGTLLSNPRFKNVAYEASFRRDLLDGFDVFMDDSIVLPMGQHYDQDTLLPILHKFMKREREVEAEYDPVSAARRASIANTSLLKAAIDLDHAGSDGIDDPLVRTKKLFGGLINDVKRRYPKYKSDITDAFNTQSLGSILFIYFAVLAPAIAFGGLVGDKTHDLIGVTETFLISAIAGIVWAFFSAQPIIVVGVTGPVLVFEESLYQICESLDIDYLGTHFWVGIWLAVLTTVATALEVSCLLRHVSRFTQDIFAFLISCVFIYESLKKIYIVFVDHPLEEYYVSLLTTFAPTLAPTVLNFTQPVQMNDTTTAASTDPLSSTLSDKDKIVGRPNTALLSLVWCIGTFYLATILKSVKTSHYFGRLARRLIGDFAIPLAILIMVVLDIIIKDTYTEKMHIPDGFSPTDATQRGWLINPLGVKKDLPIWAIFFAIVPAALFFILMFMEEQVTSLIINKNLVKGSGYHLDLNLLGLYGIIAGVLGLPVVCGATVRSVAHLNSLCVYSKTYAPGERPTLEYVIEQRVTSVFFYLLLGFSIFMGPLLRHVPVSVLFGVFLYMGVTSLNGIQFWDRVKLFFVPPKHHPDVAYVRRVKTTRMHIFTGIQVFIFVILWIVKSTKASLAFPFLLILCVPVRKYILPKFFDKKELAMLDADTDHVEEED